MFVKLFQQILDSSIADNRRLRHFFIDLLLCADQDGNVMMTEGAIARRIGSDVDEVAWGLAELVKPDPGSKTPDHDGRRIEPIEGHGFGWRIINYLPYRQLKDANQQREAVRLRVQRHRAAKKTPATTPPPGGNALQSVTVTPGNPISEAEAEADTIQGAAEKPAPATKPKKQDWKSFNEENATKANAITLPLIAPAEFRTAWAGWRVYRTRRAIEVRIASEALPWTADAAEAGIRACERAAESLAGGWKTVIARIDEAILGRWQGFNFDKLTQNHHGPYQKLPTRSDSANAPGRYA